MIPIWGKIRIGRLISKPLTSIEEFQRFGRGASAEVVQAAVGQLERDGEPGRSRVGHVSGTMRRQVTSPDDPLVVLYLFLDEQGEVLPPHPSVRTSSCLRYLECALTQVASLRLPRTSCDIALATNAHDHNVGRAGRQLLARIEALDVQILHAQPPRPPDGPLGFVGEAIAHACEDQPEDRSLWLPNLDCVWVSPASVFAATPPRGEIGCLFIPYPAEWHVGGKDTFASSRQAIGGIAVSQGCSPSDGPPPWIGADLLCGSSATLRDMLASCQRLSERFASDGQRLSGERLLSCAGAVGETRFRDLSNVAARIHTGRRHESPPPANATALGLWHLPAEKGLSLRRAATVVRHGRTNRLRRELADSTRMARRFNVVQAGFARQLRDDSWLATHQILAGLRSRRG
jgi:hypothetical protein